ncbi:MAG: trimeric autotransporter adhesin, partial [Gammaproteobacteria bacterium]|nr:trimeric autotransporter adhesin [Gammaproteobacteria bacterium]
MNKHASINRAFRLLWNDSLGTWVPVAEIARGRGKRSGRSAARVAPLLAALGIGLSTHAAGAVPGPVVRPVASLPMSIAATTLPTGGKVVAGGASITATTARDTAVLNIDQTTQRAVIDWNTFNLGADAQVNFVQPNANSATLNRVLDSNPSQIFGKITATGQVFLTNPNGVYFGKTASVDVGSLAATTSGIDNAGFMAANVTLTRKGATGSVVNEGELRAAVGGYIALLAPTVRNSGVIIAHMGTVAMAAGDSVTLHIDGNHLADIAAQPSAIAALIENKSAVIAPGGIIILSAQALDRLQGGVVKNSGTLEATGMSTAGGRILLQATRIEQTAGGSIDASGGGSVQIDARQDIALAGLVSAAAAPGAGAGADHGGSIALAAGHSVTLQDAVIDASGGAGGGRIDIQGGHGTAAQADAPTVALRGGSQLRASSLAGHGGSVTLTADRVGLFDSSAIDASGATGGGNVFVGGGFHGKDPSITDARQVVVALGVDIDASATAAGIGGNVAVWSDGQTSFAGRIAAHGGAVSGAGGFVEVSSHGNLNFLGTVAADAPHGAAGTLLLDPLNIIVATGGGASLTAGTLAFATNSSTDSTIDPGTITALSNAGTTVVLQANNDLTINSSIVTTGAGTGGSLTFQAGRSIAINAGVTSNNGNIFFTANDSGATTDRTAGVATFVNNGAIDAGSGNVSITMGTNSQYAATAGTISSGKVTAKNFSITQGGATTDAAAGAIDLGQTTVASNLTITSASATNVTNSLGTANTGGSVVVGGSASISVGAGDVTITGNQTDFNIIGLTAGNVALNDTNAVRFAATNVSGSLTETTQGPIASTGAVQVGGLATLTANNGGYGLGDPYIDLSNAANHFGGGLALSVPSTGATFTGGYATIADSGALTLNSSNTVKSLTIQAGGAVSLGAAGSTVAGTSISVTTTTGAITSTLMTAGTSVSLSTTAGGAVTTGTTTATAGAVTLATSGVGGAMTTTGTTTAGTTVSLTTSSGDISTATMAATTGSVTLTTTAGAVTTGTTNAVNLSIAGTGAVGLGTSTLTGNLSVTTNAAIINLGPLAVSNQATLTAGAANDVTLDNVNNDFNMMEIVSAHNVAVIDKNAFSFGGGASHLYGSLGVTAGGDISQQGQSYVDGYSAITVGGASTFTANKNGAQINLYLGSTDPFSGIFSGQSNTFTGGITLTNNFPGTGGGFSVVDVRDINASASVLAGLTTVGTLSAVSLQYDNAPSVSLPGMTTGSLKVNAPKVLNPGATTNAVTQTGAIVVSGVTLIGVGNTGD